MCPWTKHEVQKADEIKLYYLVMLGCPNYKGTPGGDYHKKTKQWLLSGIQGVTTGRMYEGLLGSWQCRLLIWVMINTFLCQVIELSIFVVHVFPNVYFL